MMQRTLTDESKSQLISKSYMNRLLTKAHPRWHRRRFSSGGSNLTRLGFQSFGAENAKKTVVFLHGIMGNKRNWRTPCANLVKSNPELRCIAIDLRGHGDSYNMSSGENTVVNCAHDVIETFQTYNIQPTVLSAHSFGGKVAIKYLELTKDVTAAPAVTWVLDSLPGVYDKEKMRSDSNSVLHVLEVVSRVPQPFISRDWLMRHLVTERGLSAAIAQWLATNVVPENNLFRLTLNMEVISELLNDFCKVDVWPYLENYSGDEKIYYLRAGKNSQWTPDILSRFESIANRTNENVKLLTMPHVGHWMHSEDVNGLLDIIRKHSNL